MDLRLLRQTAWTDAPKGPGVILAHEGTGLKAPDDGQTVIRYRPSSHQD